MEADIISESFQPPHSLHFTFWGLEGFTNDVWLWFILSIDNVSIAFIQSLHLVLFSEKKFFKILGCVGFVCLGRIAILVPLAENEGPLSVKSSSMLPISSTLIQIDVRASDGCLSSHYVNKIVDTCKVARFTAALSLISS